MKDWLKRRIGWSNKPKIEIRHRVRKNGWITCECSCECDDVSRWEDNLCINCFLGVHRNKYKEGNRNKL